MLVVDDEPQRGIELFGPVETRRRHADAAVEDALLVTGKRGEQLLLGREPAVEGRTRNASLRSNIRETELHLPIAAKDLGGGSEYPRSGRRIAFDRRGPTHHLSFTNHRQN